MNHAKVLRIFNLGKVSALCSVLNIPFTISIKQESGVCWGMLFDTGEDYNFMLVPIPKRQGVDKLITADDLYTPLWVHTLDNDCQWINLGKYKRQIDIDVDRGTLHYSVHFSNQHQCFPRNHSLEKLSEDFYSRWKGAILVIRTDIEGKPIDCKLKDLLYMSNVLSK